MIIAAIKADTSRLWRWLTLDPIADLQREIEILRELNSACRLQIDKLNANTSELASIVSDLNERLVSFEMDKASAPKTEPEPEPASSWQRQRLRAEQG